MWWGEGHGSCVTAVSGLLVSENGIEVKRWRNWGMGEMHKRVKRQESAAEILLDTKYLPDDVLYRGCFGTFSLLEVTLGLMSSVWKNAVSISYTVTV